MLVSVTVSVSNRNSTYLLTNIWCSCDLDFHDESLKSLTSTLPDPKYCTSFKMNTWNSSWNIHHNRVFLMSPAAILNFSVFSKMLKVYCLSADKFELSVLKSCRLKNNNNKNYIKKKQQGKSLSFSDYLHATCRGTLSHSCLSSLNHCGLILPLKVNWCVSCHDLHLKNKSTGREWMVKPYPKLLASEEKATTSLGCVPGKALC